MAYYFESGTKTFKYITVEGLKSSDYTLRSKTINHISNFPIGHFAPITRNCTIYLMGGWDGNNNHYNTCWELDLERSTMMKKQDVKNRRRFFGGAVA